MYETEKKEKFIELRAEGWTLGHIAAELNISKRSAVNWNQENAAQIQSLRALRLGVVEDKIITSREDELSSLLRLRKDMEDELANRDLARIPVEKLFPLLAELREEIRQLRREKEAREQSAAGDPGQAAAA
jgi:orotate phosphoribosyltransferase-like protein